MVFLDPRTSLGIILEQGAAYPQAKAFFQTYSYSRDSSEAGLPTVFKTR
jgi:hypothetical protein